VLYLKHKPSLSNGSCRTPIYNYTIIIKIDSKRFSDILPPPMLMLRGGGILGKNINKMENTGKKYL
jgi:hypothetical protein